MYYVLVTQAVVHIKLLCNVNILRHNNFVSIVFAARLMRETYCIVSTSFFKFLSEHFGHF